MKRRKKEKGTCRTKGAKLMYLISIDSGKAQTKWAIQNPRTGKTEKGLFTTNYKAISNEQLGKAEISVHYNGQNYSVGEPEALNRSHEGTSKLNPTHEICVYTAVAMALRKVGANLNQTQSVHLCLNVPLADYKIKEERQKYQDRYFQEEGQEVVSLTLDGQVVNFVISRLLLGYEGQGALIHASVKHPEKALGEGHTLLVDIGGHNDSVILFKNFAPVLDKNSALLNGVLKVFGSVSSVLTQKYDVPITMHDVELMSKKDCDYANQFSDFDRVFNQQAEQLFSAIRSNIKTNAENPYKTKFVFAGGGSQALKELIDRDFGQLNYIILEDAQYANCLGMLERIKEHEGEQ